MIQQTRTVLTVAAIALMASPVWGQTAYPNRAIRMVAPFAPGGASDFIARMLAPKLSERLGQTVVVDNRSGAGGNIGFEIVVRAAPDGYTLMIASSSYATNAAVTRMAFDPIKDVTPISLIGVAPLVLVVHPAVAAQSIGELVALARAQPGRLKFGSSGTGAGPHLAGELFNVSAGINLLHIPYKGSGPALIDTLSGQIEMTFISMLVVRAHINAGRLRLLGVGTPQRARALPDVPAIAETLPGFETTSWYTVMGPARMPAALVARWNTEVNALVNTPEIADRLANDTVEPRALSPEATAKHVTDEITRWKGVAQRAGVRLD
jgi:tripartite-type tricarboxylate transporter receptor subunit TctC